MNTVLERIKEARESKKNFLILSNLQIEEIPDEVFDLDLEHLVMYGCGLKKINTKINKLSNLVHLNLGDNYIEELPIELKELTKLESLYIEKNNFKIVPKVLHEMPWIKEISAYGNRSYKFKHSNTMSMKFSEFIEIN